MKKVLSVFLVSIIIFQAFASTITADAFEEKYELPKSNESTPGCCETSSSEKYNSVTSSPILYEEIGLRSENQKHYYDDSL